MKMVLKIAIVDDDSVFLDEIQNITKNFLVDKRVIAYIDTYRSHNSLLYELEDAKFYDIFLLDIETNKGEINGMEMAKKIRQKYRSVFIIFITSHMEYTLDAFKVTAFRFLPKHNLKLYLEETLEEVIHECELSKKEKHYYLIETITKYIKLYYTDIYYVYKIGKYAVFVSAIGEYRVRKSLAIVYKELDSPEFIFVERGFVANITHINRMEDAKIFMDVNNIILKVGRPQVHIVKEKIATYWGEHS